MKLYIKNKNLIKIADDSRYNLVDLKNNNFKDAISCKSINGTSYKKKISLNGLGYKCFILETKLAFKLNLSHSLEVEIPNFITRITQKKNVFLFEANDKILLGNFVEKIYNLRPSDVYKAKGFSLDSKLKIIKEVNKKNKKG